VFSPGEHPLAELAAAANAETLIVVDQLEEAFTLCRDEMSVAPSSTPCSTPPIAERS
jgi:hypothetical protein